ncbi:SDR family NAD(P)-dependent oxidoreductase [Streptomyces sp. F63]|uniref:SDR family NAD(P)-dependent oxidoreductase n=1 Tax=Streptomyces sp. F63 TaxID=2824887 RepID=UPI001B394454|nr:SDR family NAD(P)-dependent oxidoreductase [Streptomyces sp. F63]MBQ0984750.1 SDR family NAD(P)-dependent oxidoreductase [Streptomyces sp. F63]
MSEREYKPKRDTGTLPEPAPRPPAPGPVPGRAPGSARQARPGPRGSAAPATDVAGRRGTGPVVLVTGASSGIGAAVARRMSAPGGDRRLLLNGRDRTRLAEVAAVSGGTALPGDLATAEGCRALARQALERAGRVDVLVASAGVGHAGRFEAMPPSALDELITVNLTSTLHLVHALLPAMVRRGSGHLVLVASIAGAVGVGGESVYAAAKGGLCVFADSLRYEVREAGVSVSVVLPGVVDTPFFERRGAPYRRRVPRPVPPERVADAVCRAVERRCHEVFVPRWLRIPARFRGAAPALYHRMASRLA